MTLHLLPISPLSLPGYSPYFLGWDASAWANPKAGTVCIHHPAGDTKKSAASSKPLTRSSW